MKIQTPAGETFRVHRRWMPWQRRADKAMDWLPSGPGAMNGFGDDPISLVIGAVFLIPVLLILAFFLGELLLLLLLLPFFVLARSVFGTPWIIEVTHQREVVHAEEALGWTASQQQIESLAAAMRLGDLPPGVPERVKAKAKEKAKGKKQKDSRAKVKSGTTAKPKTSVRSGTAAKPKAPARSRTAAKPKTTTKVQDTPRPGSGIQDTIEDPQNTIEDPQNTTQDPPPDTPQDTSN